VPVVLQPKERDALWAQIAGEFTLFGDLDQAMHRGEAMPCEDLGRKIADGFRLIIDGGLGWKKHVPTPTVLTLPASELIEIFSRMEEQAISRYGDPEVFAGGGEAEIEEIETVRAAAASVFEQARLA